MLWQREAQESQTYQPALCSDRDFLDNLIRELDTHHVLEESLRFFYGTAQLVRTNLRDVLTCSQLQERQGRISSCGHNDPQLGWKMLDQIDQGSVYLLLGDELIVIQDEHNVLCALHEQ